MTEWIDYPNWDSVLADAKRDGVLYYHAPLDYRPVNVHVVRVFKNGKLRLDPITNNADPFTADAAHLPRFKRRAK